MWIELAPLVVAAFVCTGASFLCLRSHWKEFLWLPGLLLFAWLIAPDLQRQDYIGHEASYIDFFLGKQQLTEGTTLSYPAMQLWWWFWGLVLPENPRWCSLIALAWGSMTALMFGHWVRLWFGDVLGVLASIWLLSHPVFLAWSTSPYNVIFPIGFGMMAVLAWDMGARTKQRHWFYLAASALLWAAAMRLELGVFYLLVLAWAFANRVDWRLWLGPWLLSLILLACSLSSVMQSIPGEGERWLAFQLNWSALTYFAPYNNLLGGLLLIISGVIACRKHWPQTLVLGLAVLGNHLLMATFDDYGFRHTLFMLLANGWLLACAAHTMRSWGWLLALACVILHVMGLQHVHERYYASQEQFVAFVRGKWGNELPEISLQDARKQGCAWIAEAEPVVATKARSHFNLLDSNEVQKMQKDFGCIDWCYDLEDWRLTSLSVRDRTLRIQSMYQLQPLAIVQQDDYRCVQFRLSIPISKL